MRSSGSRALGRLGAYQRLGAHHHHRLAEVSHALAAQHVEVVGGRRHVGDLPVGRLEACLLAHLVEIGHCVLVVIAHLQEALEACGRVLGPLPFVAVREQHAQPGLAQPLLLASGDELVDHALGRVGKVTELRLPHDERCGVLQRVAELEAEHGKFGEGRVARVELRLRGRDVLERCMHTPELLLVMDNAVTVRECPALHVLPRDAHVVALREQRAPGELLRQRPVDTLASLDHLIARAVDLANHTVRREIVRQLGDRTAHLRIGR